MPYLPEAYTHDTQFPAAFDRDLKTQLKLIDEQAERMFPRIVYYRIKKTTGIAPTDPVTSGPAPTGAAGETTFDPLYGEQVDAAIAGQWEQPHLNPDVKASTVEIEVYEDPVEIRARVQREPKDKEAKKYGFDETRDLMLHVPCRQLDRLGITVLPGDKFVWDGEEYTVLQDKDTGYWKNTNISVWRTLLCEHKRRSA